MIKYFCDRCKEQIKEGELSKMRMYYTQEHKMMLTWEVCCICAEKVIKMLKDNLK